MSYTCMFVESIVGGLRQSLDRLSHLFIRKNVDIR
jgi:hypothetical protein